MVWSGWQKWAATGFSVFLVLMSERCPFILACRAFSVSPTYCRPHFFHVIRFSSCMTVLLLLMLYCLPVILLLDVLHICYGECFLTIFVRVVSLGWYVVTRDTRRCCCCRGRGCRASVQGILTAQLHSYNHEYMDNVCDIVCSVVGIHNIVYNRFSSLCTSALLHHSSLVRTIFTDSSRTCNSNFIGYNCLYGASHCKSYSPNHIAIGNLVREIRSTHTFIPHFSHNELEAIVSAVVL